MTFVSYARNGEDVLLNRVFAAADDGFYLDFGAADPVDGSVTKALYDRGWSGINAVPKAAFARLAAARPRDINLRMDLPAGTLAGILAAHAPNRRIDLLRIDAGGAEAAVIVGTDWRAVRPTVLVIAATLPGSNELANAAWEPVLLAQGYRRAWFDGTNCFYLPVERDDLLRHFALPINALDHWRPHDPGLAAAREELAAELRTQQTRLVEELNWPDAPVALRAVLPLARLLRRGSAALRPARRHETGNTGMAAPAIPADRARGVRSAARRLAQGLWGWVKPVLRPLVWRTRIFIAARLRAALARLDAKFEARVDATKVEAPPPPDASAAAGRDTHDAVAQMLETVLLTLALERGSDKAG
jgi:hypothetical protein